MASRQTGTRGSRGGLGAPGTTGAQETRDPLGAPGTTGAAPTFGGFEPASYDPSGGGQGQMHRSVGDEPTTGYDFEQGDRQGQQHRPAGVGGMEHEPNTGYDFGQGGRQGQQHRTACVGGMEHDYATRGHHEKGPTGITTTTGGYYTAGTDVGPTGAATTGVPTATVTSVYTTEYDTPGTTTGYDTGGVGITGDVASREENRGMMDRVKEHLPGTRQARDRC